MVRPPYPQSLSSTVLRAQSRPKASNQEGGNYLTRVNEKKNKYWVVMVSNWLLPSSSETKPNSLQVPPMHTNSKTAFYVWMNKHLKNSRYFRKVSNISDKHHIRN